MANGNGKKKKKKIILVSGGIAAGVIILLILIAAKSGGTVIDKSKIGEVKRETLAKNVVATGKITPITKAEIKSKASGIVKKWYKDAGQPVKAGEVLVELDKEEILTHVHQAEADLQAAEASRNAAQADVSRATVDAEGPDVPLLKRTYERAEQMAKEGVFSQSQLEDAQKNYELALNKQNVARANLIVSKAKLTQETAAVAKSRAALEQNKQEYQYSTIVAPIDGIVLSRDVEIGDAVSSILVMGSAATQIMTIGDIHEVYVLGKVDESDIGKVTMNQPARIKVESFKDKTFNGKVTKIAPMGVEKDNVTTFEVRVSIDNPGGELKTTMTANAEIILEEHPDVLTVPEAAIIYDKDKKAYVEVVDPKAKEGKRKISITAGISNGSKTEVLSGLKEKDQVVLQ
ncbi:MAG TPA: efflux RND transporter periplasmic adaptor subunit [Terriglobales bacterium]|jgi:HlyD family secretion protein|nr:efflux RND transporter periplasmic adaptor subunit [Terriglobales bacterium]